MQLFIDDVAAALEAKSVPMTKADVVARLEWVIGAPKDAPKPTAKHASEPATHRDLSNHIFVANQNGFVIGNVCSRRKWGASP